MGEWRWAWRNVRARGWRGVIAVALLAVSLAASTIVFSVADALVLTPVAYPAADTLVTFDARDPGGRPLSSIVQMPEVVALREHTDLFTDVHAYASRSLFLTDTDTPELVQAADITAGLVEMLGVPPRWGRTPALADASRDDIGSALIAEDLARRRFGDPASAIDRQLATASGPLRVSGVMPASFRFPDGRVRIWRFHDPARAGVNGARALATLSAGVSIAHATAQLSARRDSLAATPPHRVLSVVPFEPLRRAGTQPVLPLFLFGAAIALLLTACANVVSLELAAVMARRQATAIELAMGAPGVAIVRRTLIEGVILVGTAAATSLVLARAGVTGVAQLLPQTFTNGINVVDIDLRAFGVAAALAVGAWLAASVPTAIVALRADLLTLLRVDGMWSSLSLSGVNGRRVLTVVQVAVAVTLVALSTLAVRSYLVLIALDKGFDSRGVLAATLTFPTTSGGTVVDRGALAAAISERLRTHPGVIGVFEGAPPPSTGDSPMGMTAIEVDNRPPVATDLRLPQLWVDNEYFRVLGIPLLDGRLFTSDDTLSNVVISRGLAQALWPEGGAVGGRFREGPKQPWQQVIGVVADVRRTENAPDGAPRYFQKYVRRRPPPAPARAAVSDISYALLTLTVRIDERTTAREIAALIRGIDPRHMLRVEMADDQFARQFSDRGLAAQTMTAFGILAWLVAAAGLYSLMAFLIAQRQREIGIRLALGAGESRIRRAVLLSALRLTVAGVALGVAVLWGMSRWTASLLYGVSATDPVAVTAVVASIATTALLAAWIPARQAGCTDFVILLKA